MIGDNTRREKYEINLKTMGRKNRGEELPLEEGKEGRIKGMKIMEN